MAKIKIHELAKELDIQSKDIVSFLKEKGSETFFFLHGFVVYVLYFVLFYLSLPDPAIFYPPLGYTLFCPS